jgi:hypothetical protein
MFLLRPGLDKDLLIQAKKLPEFYVKKENDIDVQEVNVHCPPLTTI